MIKLANLITIYCNIITSKVMKDIKFIKKLQDRLNSYMLRAHGSLHGKNVHMKWYLKPGKGIDFSLHCESSLSPGTSWQAKEVVINLYTCKRVISPSPQRRGFASRILGDNRVSSVQSLSRVWFFATPWTAAHQASLFITGSWNLLKLMSIESVMASNHLILCQPLLLLP